MEKRISEVRKAEINKLWDYLVVNGLLREILFFAVPLAAFFIFCTYAFMMNRNLSPVTVFKVIAYLNTLRFPSNLFGQALKNLSGAIICIYICGCGGV